jgi:nuclease HARBI1
MERRRALRELNIWQRGEGLNIARLLEGRKSLTYCIIFFLMSTVIPDRDIQRLLTMLGMYYGSRYYRCAYGPVLVVPPLVRANRRIAQYDPADFRVKFRFEKRHAHKLMDCLGFTQQDIVCDNGTHCNSEEAFLIMLCRMASYQRLSDMEEHFGIDYSMLSRIFNTCVEEVVANKYHLLFKNVGYFESRFAMYNAAIRAKILEGGFHLPAAAADTALFTDGKSLQISRPSGPDINQARVYNGHHRVHCLQFQGTSAPDGMIVDLFGPVAGSRHDQHVNDISGFNERLRDCQIGNALQFKDYADKGYIVKSHGHVAYKGKNLPQPLVDANMAMSPQRIGIEWAFNKISQISAFVDQYKIQRVQLSQVAKYYWLAALLANANTCLYGSNASRYWGVQPPTLGSYFGKPQYDFVDI